MINLSTLAYSRVYNQYRDKENAVKWYNITPTLGQNFITAYGDIKTSYDIDTNFGEQLNIIGRVIDIDRGIIGTVNFPVFECGDETVEAGNTEAQCSFRFLSDSSDLEDQYFRPLLKAKVAKNTSNATIDSIISATKIILSSNQNVKLRDSEDMTVTIEIYDGLSDIDRVLLTKDIIPRPQGVKLRGVLDGIGITELGNESLMSGDTSSECVGLIEVN